MKMKKDIKNIEPCRLYEVAGVIAATILERGGTVEDVDDFLNDEAQMMCALESETVIDETARGLRERDILILKLRQAAIAEQCTAYLDRKFPQAAQIDNEQGFPQITHNHPGNGVVTYINN